MTLRGFIDRILEATIAVMLIITVVVAFLEVVLRYGFNTSLIWSFEFLLIVLTYMSFVGALLALRQRAHLRILVIYFMLPHIGQVILFVINQLAIGVTTVVMAYWGWDYAFRFIEKTTLILEWPVTWLYIVIPLSGVAMTLQVLHDLYKGLRRVFSGLSPEEEMELGSSTSIEGSI